MDKQRHQVLIIGSGPAGMFAADQLLQLGVTDVVVAERGKAMSGRVCPPGAGCDCRFCDVLEGDGGAGSFSDGKITLSATRGTHGQQLFTAEQERLLSIIDARFRKFVPDGVDYPPIPVLAALDGHDDSGLRFEAYPLLHVGSDGVRLFGQRFCDDLRQRGVAILSNTEVTDVHIVDSVARGAALRDWKTKRQWEVSVDAVVVASGMMGTVWLEQQLADAGIALETGPADIGIRVETTAQALDPFIGDFYDFKVSRTNADGITTRSFCVNGRGFIVNEYHRPLGIRAVNGHSFLNRQSEQSNLAVLATIDQQVDPDPKAWVRRLAREINASTGGYPIRQDLSGFLGEDKVRGRRQGVTPSNPKTRPGRLDLVLPPLVRDALAGYVLALGEVLPPVLSPDTVLYAPEIKYYNYRVPVDLGSFESQAVTGLYVVGNAAGYTASLSAAALSGIVAARAIAASFDHAEAASV